MKKQWYKKVFSFSFYYEISENFILFNFWQKWQKFFKLYTCIIIIM